MDIALIEKNTRCLLETLSPDVTLVAAATTRLPEEVEAAVCASVARFGHNYIQEAE